MGTSKPVVISPANRLAKIIEKTGGKCGARTSNYLPHAKRAQKSPKGVQQPTVSPIMKNKQLGLQELAIITSCDQIRKSRHFESAKLSSMVTSSPWAVAKREMAGMTLHW